MHPKSDRAICGREAREKGKTLILALGNPLRGDDGIGAAILDELNRMTVIPEDVHLLDGGTMGLEITLLLEGYQQAIIIDSANVGCAPGEWNRFSKQEILPRLSNQRGSYCVHRAGLSEALELGDTLGILPPIIVIYGIQPECTLPSQNISEPVKNAIPMICADIRERFLDNRGDGVMRVGK
jgi:hydrogenase maturation protease